MTTARTDAELDRLERLTKMRADLAELETFTVIAVAQARTHGLTWAAIGRALGTSKQAAWERYGRSLADLTNPTPPTE